MTPLEQAEWGSCNPTTLRSRHRARTVSNDTRVLAEGLAKIMAIVWPLKGLKLSSLA